MTTSAQARANRRNAKRSTGPKTATGKRRAARNATRHGLSIPIAAVPELGATINKLAKLIAGADANPRRLGLAWRIAAAQIDLRRVRKARLDLMRGVNWPPRYLPIKVIKHRIWLAEQAYEINRRIDVYPELFDGTESKAERDFVRNEIALDLWLATMDEPFEPIAEPTTEPERTAVLIDYGRQQMARLDRYERRALSRRKSAARAFDEEAAHSST